jgi:predicted DsbA family dithiol-disulfide isomerase
MTIDIVSDVVCPWCWIGKRRLESALEQRGRSLPHIRWHPFQLNPDIPAGGVDRGSYLTTKFGGPERARQIYERVEAAGREAGIAFDFARIARQPNTVEAHRLIEWGQAADPGRASVLVERLFSAYFTEGVDLGDVEALAGLAGDAGYDVPAARAHLASDAERASVAEADARMKGLGVTGVPFFIFNQRLAVSGAQPPDILADAMEQADH